MIKANKRLNRVLTYFAALLLFSGFVAFCLAAPYLYTTYISDKALYGAPHALTANASSLSPEGRECVLASTLYAQTHIVTRGETYRAGFFLQQDEDGLDTAIAGLIAANVLPEGFTVHGARIGKEVTGLLTHYIASNDYVSLTASVENVTDKVVSLSWESVEQDTALLLERYIEYLGLSGYSYAHVTPLSAAVEVQAVYFEGLQLYVSATQDTRGDSISQTINTVSMEKSALLQIASFT